MNPVALALALSVVSTLAETLIRKAKTKNKALPAVVLAALLHIAERRALGKTTYSTEIERELGVNNPTMGLAIARLVEAGLVIKKPLVPGEVVRLLELTPEGVALVEAALDEAVPRPPRPFGVDRRTDAVRAGDTGLGGVARAAISLVSAEMPVENTIAQDEIPEAPPAPPVVDLIEDVGKKKAKPILIADERPEKPAKGKKGKDEPVSKDPAKGKKKTPVKLVTPRKAKPGAVASSGKKAVVKLPVVTVVPALPSSGKKPTLFGKK